MKELLTEEQKADNKKVIIKFLRDTEREGIEGLISFLEGSDFFTAPASTKYHGNYPGALAEHSLNVYKILAQKNMAYQELDLAIDTMVLAALLHDLCKIDFYKIETKWRKDGNGKWESYEAYTWEDKFPCGHGEKSAIIALQYIKLTEEEILMIRHHMGAFQAPDNHRAMQSAIKLYSGIVALATADWEVSTFMEKTLEMPTEK